MKSAQKWVIMHNKAYPGIHFSGNLKAITNQSRSHRLNKLGASNFMKIYQKFLAAAAIGAMVWPGLSAEKRPNIRGPFKIYEWQQNAKAYCVTQESYKIPMDFGKGQEDIELTFYWSLFLENKEMKRSIRSVALKYRGRTSDLGEKAKNFQRFSIVNKGGIEFLFCDLGTGGIRISEDGGNLIETDISQNEYFSIIKSDGLDYNEGKWKPKKKQ